MTYFYADETGHWHFHRIAGRGRPRDHGPFDSYAQAVKAYCKL